MTVEAGVILKTIQETAAAHDRLFPLSLAAEGSCTIGGNLSTNAGGVQVLHYGNARHLVLGLEVVTPPGRDLERPAGAQEGQYRLRPARPLSRRRGHARHHHQGGAEAVAQAQGRGDRVDRRALARGRRRPAERRPCRQRGQRHLLRADGPPGRRSRAAAHSRRGRSAGRAPRLVRAAGMVFDPRRAARAPTRPACAKRWRPISARRWNRASCSTPPSPRTRPRRARLWALRENHSEASEARRPLDQARHLRRREQDPRLHDRRARGDEEGAARLPAGAVRPCRRRQPPLQLPGARRAGTRQRFNAHGEAISGAVYDLVVGYGGSISAEHGIGLLKVDELAHYRSKIELDAMRVDQARARSAEPDEPGQDRPRLDV